MKRVLAIICTNVLLLTQMITFSSAANIYDTTRDSQLLTIAQCYATSDNHSLQVGNPIPLYNLSETLEAYCYPLFPTGYVIISYKTGKIIECSKTASCPIRSSSFHLEGSAISPRYYYNGILQYYEKLQNKYMHTKTLETYSQSELTESLNENFIYDIYSPARSLADSTTSQCIALPNTNISSSTTWYCGITAVTILLDWYENYAVGTYYPSHISNIAGLRRFLFNSSYISKAGGLTLLDIRDGIDSFTGLESYLDRSDITNQTVNVTRNSYSTISGRILNSHQPAILLIPTSILNPSQTGNHLVIVYGIGEIEGENDSYYIVNDVWGHNDVWINNGYVTLGSNRLLYLS